MPAIDSGESSMDLEYRLATRADLEQLAELRWDFRAEDGEEQPVVTRPAFVEACIAFLEAGLASGDQAYWLALCGEEIIAQIFVHRIPMVPRPCKIEDYFGYVTNNYTKPAYRGRGIGGQLMQRVEEWARQEDLEVLIVWPSERAVSFYDRSGFKAENDIMEMVLRDYYEPGNPS